MKQADERALGQYLGVRARSREEVSRYLKKRKVDELEIGQLLERWEELGILNDTSFTDAVVRSYLKKGKGQLFIRHKLQEAGIPREQINEVLGQIPKEDLRQAMEKRLLKVERRLESLPPKLKRQKALSILAASGFLMEAASHFIDDWVVKE